jgi:hypothetical protein
MNRRPSAKSHASGAATVSQLFAPLISAAPSTGPNRVPRPPTATQMAISTEFAGDISEGLMIPTCGTYSAPAMPQMAAESVQTKSLKPTGS